MITALYPSALRRPTPTLSLLVLALAGGVLAGCASGPAAQPATQSPTAVPSNGTARADALLAQAANTQSSDPAAAAKLRLQAAALYADNSAWPALQRTLGLLSKTELEAPDRALRKALRAQLRLGQGRDPLKALDGIPAPQADFPPATNARIQAAYAQALLAVGDVAAAVGALVERENYLPTPRAREANREQLWAMLLEAPLGGGALQARDDSSPTALGWIALARIARSAWIDSAALDSAWLDWQQQFAPHPAQPDFVSRAQQLAGRSVRMPQNVALLLPQTGRLATPAAAVRDGFMAAWLQAGGGPRVQVLDTETADIATLVERARAAGAEVIVGPLRKDRVEQLMQLNLGGLPVLALNRIETSTQALPDTAQSNGFRPLLGNSVFQFALAPEDEARQVADTAVSQGLRRAIALAPDNDAGRRTLDAFRIRMAEQGGQTVDARLFEDDTKDFSDAIRAMLDLQASRDRAREIAKALGEQPEFQPRRRSDVDFVFAPVREADARQIKPQLKFHFAGDLPVYATSRINDGGRSPGSNADIDGVRFVDSPWVLDDSNALDALRAPIAEYWPRRSEAMPRLYAFGIDAFRLLPLIQAGEVSGEQFIPAASGDLFIRSDRTIGRSLLWGVFENGEPTRALPAENAN